MLATWLAPRTWREIDYLSLLNEEIRRYGMAFERRHITLLAKQSFQEAEHYEMVGKAIESLGGTAPTSVPASASGSFEPTFRAAERHGFDEVMRIYSQIEIDEKFHVGLGGSCWRAMRARSQIARRSSKRCAACATSPGRRSRPNRSPTLEPREGCYERSRSDA
ncbi:MAG: hypothetical protein ACRDQ7_09450 [Haloechinothrix sp.]